MANYANLKAAIDTVIKANGQQEITGTVLNQTLTAMVNSLGAGYLFMGVAIPSTNPGTPDQNVFYLAGQAGTYSNFGAITLQAGIFVLKWNGTWSSETLLTFDASITQNSGNPITSGAVFEKMKLDGGAYDVSAHNNNQTFASLSALLSDANLSTLIPTNIRSGGMSIKFIQTSDNKYVQARCMAQNFTTDVAQWQGVDNEPTVGSDNLVKSGGVDLKYAYTNQEANIVDIPNEYWKADGTIGSSTTYKRSKMYPLADSVKASAIPIITGEIVAYGSIPTVIFFGANKTTVVGTLSTYYNATGANKSIAVADIPNTAKYIAFNSAANVNVLWGGITWGADKKQLKDKDSSLQTQITNLTTIVNDKDNVPTFGSTKPVKSNGIAESINYLGNTVLPIEGEYFKSDGTIGTGPSYRRSMVLPINAYVDNFDKLYDINIIKGNLYSSGTAIPSVIFLGSDKTTVVGTLYANFNPTRPIFPTEIPANAKYIGFNALVSETEILIQGFSLYADLQQTYSQYVYTGFSNSYVAGNNLLRSLSSIQNSFMDLYGKIGYFANSAAATTASGYTNRIDMSVSSGKNIIVKATGSGSATDQIPLYADTNLTTLIGYINIGQTKTFTLAQDITMVYARAYTITENQDVLLEVVVVNSIIDRLDKKDTQIQTINTKLVNKDDELGKTYTVTKTTTQYTFNASVNHSFKAGQRVVLTLIGGNIVSGKTIAFVSTGFSSTQYITYPQRSIAVDIVNDTEEIKCTINPDALSAGDSITLSVTICGIETVPKNKALRPLITLIDDDTLNIAHVQAFRDACVANNIVGTFACITQQLEDVSGLTETLRTYEREGFQVVLHCYTQANYFEYETRDLAECQKNIVHGLQDMHENTPFVDYNFWVTPYGVQDNDMKMLAKRWGLKCLVAIGQYNTYVGKDGTNYHRYGMPRIGFNATDEGNSTMANLKALLDAASLEGGWVLVGTHMYNGWTPELISTRFKEMCDYAKAKGFTFVTLGEGMREREYCFRYFEDLGKE